MWCLRRMWLPPPLRPPRLRRRLRRVPAVVVPGRDGIPAVRANSYLVAPCGCELPAGWTSAASSVRLRRRERLSRYGHDEHDRHGFHSDLHSLPAWARIRRPRRV